VSLYQTTWWPQTESRVILTRSRHQPSLQIPRRRQPAAQSMRVPERVSSATFYLDVSTWFHAHQRRWIINHGQDWSHTCHVQLCRNIFIWIPKHLLFRKNNTVPLWSLYPTMEETSAELHATSNQDIFLRSFREASLNWRCREIDSFRVRGHAPNKIPFKIYKKREKQGCWIDALANYSKSPNWWKELGCIFILKKVIESGGQSKEPTSATQEYISAGKNGCLTEQREALIQGN
jgi:hypothetical protein